MNKITVKDIYSGKPDAKDEINFEGLSGFIKTFIVPRNSDLESLLTGNHCFISGYKGTGKTALLFYLDNLIRERDSSACSSFVFFKEEFAELKKEEFDKFSKRGLSSITIDKDTLLNNSEFEYIWRWLFFKRIVADNEEFNGGLFVENEQWSSFIKIVSKIKGPVNIKKSVIPNRVKLALPFTDLTGASIGPEMEVDLSKNSVDNNYSSFVKLVDDAENALSKVTKTDIPYHIFVDELEAYYGDQEVFKRDLYLIRDLIFTIKRFNSIFSSSNISNIKIICSIRSEIVNAISRFIVTKELNKVTSGFEIPLRWNYNNTNSFNHPIMQILLRRIAISESEDDEKYRSDKEIIAQWFPETIHDIEPSNYVLNNSWNKPRDIVRFIISAQNSINSDSSSFSQAVFSSLHKQYSIDSLIEIREEMRALYTSEQIEDIINVFTGFKSIFSVDQLRTRVSKFFGNSIMDTNFNAVVNDLYRLGFIGNYFPASQMYRWQHKGDDRLIISDEWRIMIHQALQSALSVGKRHDYSMKRLEKPQIGDVVSFEVKGISKSFVDGVIDYYGKLYPAYIHISKVTDTYIHDINDFVTKGEELRTVITEYDERKSKWSLKKIQS
ncbi:P-loop ATPase, Sll1717 family [Metabacillus sp. JX24]|uniref:P-loop ATPase, Sll1717 family n=1 Tax=Metabacillus sp. JX24 TaxID=3240759 RepID=UPI003510B48C